ncbi:hypothetical protein [Halalkalicoccus sp. NIPERK01]|uniref:hypothetical protein n=1 Tax=Halalkalicoccus sp. NIPERK01 TaxID=3053469 RepID=UPI00256ECC6F|nr:hypothetical protein [Halalkalicoccus sp. NIPERK01]MDL5362844.1 hypothetical protein [Halalkalicoccus sp. NIPERK01]
MTDYAVHEPEYSGTTDDEWEDPQLNDFETDDLGEVADHFLLSASGFPPENFSDLKLPVVDPEGNLNLNALQTAHGGAHGVEAIDDVDEETVEEVEDLLEDLASEEFDHDLGD